MGGGDKEDEGGGGKIRRSRAELKFFAESLRRELAEQSIRIGIKLVVERRDHRRVCVQEHARREQALRRLHDAEMNKLRMEHLVEQHVPSDVSANDDVSRLASSPSVLRKAAAAADRGRQGLIPMISP